MTVVVSVTGQWAMWPAVTAWDQSRSVQLYLCVHGGVAVKPVGSAIGQVSDCSGDSGTCPLLGTHFREKGTQMGTAVSAMKPQVRKPFSLYISSSS